MVQYATTHQTTLGMAKLSILGYRQTLTRLFPLIVLIVLLKDIVVYFGGWPKNAIFALSIAVGIVVVSFYLYAAALYLTDSVLKGRPCTVHEAFQTMLKRLSDIYLGFFAWILFLCASLLLGYIAWIAVIRHATMLPIMRAYLAITMMGGMFLAMMIAAMLMLPLVVLDDVPPIEALKRSVQWIVPRHIFQSFIVYALSVLFYIFVMSHTRHVLWLIDHFLLFPFDIVAFSIFLPLWFNFILHWLNDMKLHYQSNLNVITHQ